LRQQLGANMMKKTNKLATAREYFAGDADQGIFTA
jgi:hypothetical protein